MAAADHSVGKDAGRDILTVNAGSSSVRFALYRRDNPPPQIFHGKVDRIGLPDAYLAFARQSSTALAAAAWSTTATARHEQRLRAGRGHPDEHAYRRHRSGARALLRGDRMDDGRAISSDGQSRIGFLGIALDPAQNFAGADVISAKGSRVAARVIRTDEEAMIARGVIAAMNNEQPVERAGEPSRSER